MKHLEAGPFECADRRLVDLESDRRALVGIRKAIAILDVDAGVIERVEHAGEAARNIGHFDGNDLREVAVNPASEMGCDRALRVTQMMRAMP